MPAKPEPSNRSTSAVTFTSSKRFRRNRPFGDAKALGLCATKRYLMKLVSRSCGVTFSVTFVSTNSAVAENVFVIALGLCGVEVVGGRRGSKALAAAKYKDDRL